MIGNQLRTPTGSSSEANFQRSQKDAVERSRISDTPGARVNRTTRGVVIEYDSTRKTATDGDKRLFSYCSGTGAAIGDVSTLPDLDVGTVITGWTTAIEADIKEALRSGKRLRTVLLIEMTVEQVTASTISQANLKLKAYTGDESNPVAMVIVLPAAAQSAVYLFSMSHELTQAIDGLNCTFTEANVIVSGQQLGSTIGDYFPCNGVISTGSTTSSVVNFVDGKIIGAVELAENCNANLKLRCLTIDSLPSL